MTVEEDERTNEHGLLSGIRGMINVNFVALFVLGITAGYSATLLGTDVVSIPVLGPVPGLLAGTVGLTVAGLAYLQVGCCGDCGSAKLGFTGDCGCSGDCGDSCSYDS